MYGKNDATMPDPVILLVGARRGEAHDTIRAAQMCIPG